MLQRKTIKGKHKESGGGNITTMQNGIQGKKRRQPTLGGFLKDTSKWNHKQKADLWLFGASGGLERMKSLPARKPYELYNR